MSQNRLNLPHAHIPDQSAGQSKLLAVLAIALLLLGGAIVGASVAAGTVGGVLGGVVVAAAGQVLKRRSGSCSCC